MSDYKVEIATPEEIARVLGGRSMGPDNKNGRRSIVGMGDFEIQGEFFLTARDVNTNEIEWQHSEKNLITDTGRRAWFSNRLSSSMLLGFSPDTRAPISGRCSSTTDVTQAFASGNLTPTNTPATHTKTFSTTFGVPGSNRTLGTVFLCTSTPPDVRAGPVLMISYVLLTPSRVQTTTNTIEVTYKISMNPIT